MYELGYEDGYNGRAKQYNDFTYEIGYNVGMKKRLEQ